MELENLESHIILEQKLRTFEGRADLQGSQILGSSGARLRGSFIGGQSSRVRLFGGSNGIQVNQEVQTIMTWNHT